MLTPTIAQAADSLDFFYNAILYNALAAWSTRPPQQVLVVTMGSLRLTMKVVYDGGIRQGISWAFVRNFARNMLAMTARGFSGTYDMYYTRGDRLSFDFPGLGVEVTFRILWGT